VLGAHASPAPSFSLQSPPLKIHMHVSMMSCFSCLAVNMGVVLVEGAKGERWILCIFWHQMCTLYPLPPRPVDGSFADTEPLEVDQFGHPPPA
jgi:hypothetical protein